VLTSQNIYIDEESLVESSVIFDHVKIGKNVRLNKCIVDKGVIIPDNESVGYNLNEDRKRFTVTDSGIVVIPQGYIFNN